MRVPLVRIVPLVLLAAHLAAQVQFKEIDKFKLLGNTRSLCVAAGDLDGDGRIDLVFGRTGTDVVYLNDGKGRFTPVNLPASTDTTLSVALGDVDGDRDLDIVFGNNSGERTRLLRNDGGGMFTDLTATNMPNDSDRTRGVVLTDVDGDRDLDLVCANGGRGISQQSRLYLNNGSGVFTDATAARMPTATSTTYAVAAGDVDRDGDPDLVFANVGTFGAPAAAWLYLNDGTGVFRDASARLPSANNQHAASVTLADVDGDGNIDIFLSNYTNGPFGNNSLWFNDGSGNFTDVTATNLTASYGETEAGLIGDVTGDGAADLIAIFKFDPPILFVNDGTGVLTEQPRMPVLLELATGGVLVDLDSDRDLDVVIATDGVPDRALFDLFHQVHAPMPARINNTYPIDIHARPGFAATTIFAVTFIGVQELPFDLVIEPFGAFRINPQLMLSLPPVTIPVPGGSTRINIGLPNIRALVNQTIYTQAFVIHTTSQNDWRITNLMDDVVGV